MENLLGKDKLLQFDDLSFYKKYTGRFDIDSVPERERNEGALQVAEWVLKQVDTDSINKLKH